MKVLGVVCEKEFAFAGQFAKILERAKIRMAIIAKLLGSVCVLDAKMLETTGQALAISLFRYGLTIIGSGLTEKRLRQWNTFIINVFARKIAGAGPSARLPILHTVVGTLTADNLYVQNCGNVMNLSPRAHDSSIREGLYAWLRRAYGIQTWNP